MRLQRSAPLLSSQWEQGLFDAVLWDSGGGVEVPRQFLRKEVSVQVVREHLILEHITMITMNSLPSPLFQ